MTLGHSQHVHDEPPGLRIQLAPQAAGVRVERPGPAPEPALRRTGPPAGRGGRPLRPNGGGERPAQHRRSLPLVTFEPRELASRPPDCDRIRDHPAATTNVDSAAMPLPQLQVSRTYAKGRLTVQTASAKLLLGETPVEAVDESGSPYREWTRKVEKWIALTRDALLAIYEEEDPAQEFKDAVEGEIFRYVDQDESDTLQYRKEAVERGVHVLESLVERLIFAREPADEPASQHEELPLVRSVFVIHGRDDGLRDQVARVLERLDFEPVILSEEPNEGRTLIEKFEDKSLEIGFAVAILSPDDFVSGPDDTALPDVPNRARQNVILELGYFMGRLGRRRVAALAAPGVETPSDIHGLGYIDLDKADWPFKLGAELAAAGFKVDVNQLT
jgi:predicted nucleotide-binding protein